MERHSCPSWGPVLLHSPQLVLSACTEQCTAQAVHARACAVQCAVCTHLPKGRMVEEDSTWPGRWRWYRLTPRKSASCSNHDQHGGQWRGAGESGSVVGAGVRGGGGLGGEEEKEAVCGPHVTTHTYNPHSFTTAESWCSSSLWGVSEAVYKARKVGRSGS